MSIKAKLLKAGDKLIQRGINMYKRRSEKELRKNIFSHDPKLLRKKIQDATGVKIEDPFKPRYIDPKEYRKFKEELRKR